MEENVKYSDCELRYLDQGFDIESAAAACAEAGKSSSDEESGRPSEDEGRDDYWGET